MKMNEEHFRLSALSRGLIALSSTFVMPLISEMSHTCDKRYRHGKAGVRLLALLPGLVVVHGAVIANHFWEVCFIRTCHRHEGLVLFPTVS